MTGVWDHAANVRAHAAVERARAAVDRESAAADRAAAARDRELLKEALEQAQLDPLTGALGRGLGMVALEREMNRARHGTGGLVLAFVDVDNLKQVNDSPGDTLQQLTERGDKALYEAKHNR